MSMSFDSVPFCSGRTLKPLYCLNAKLIALLVFHHHVGLLAY